MLQCKYTNIMLLCNTHPETIMIQIPQSTTSVGLHGSGIISRSAQRFSKPSITRFEKGKPIDPQKQAFRACFFCERAPSIERDAFDPQAQGAGGNTGLGYFADLLAHQGGAYRGFQRNLAGLQVHFVGADNLKPHTGISREVREFDPAQKADPVFR